MEAAQLAALIAAVAFALLVCVAVFVLFRLARLLSAATGLVAEYRTRTDTLLTQAQAAVDRTTLQLDRTEAITGSLDEVTANMAELSGHVSALAGLARSMSSAASAPLSGAAALVYGLRRATAVRRSMHVAAVAEPLADPAPRPALAAADTAQHPGSLRSAGRR